MTIRLEQAIINLYPKSNHKVGKMTKIYKEALRFLGGHRTESLKVTGNVTL